VGRKSNTKSYNEKIHTVYFFPVFCFFPLLPSCCDRAVLKKNLLSAPTDMINRVISSSYHLHFPSFESPAHRANITTHGAEAQLRWIWQIQNHITRKATHHTSCLSPVFPVITILLLNRDRVLLNKKPSVHPTDIINRVISSSYHLHLPSFV
jgi:hypothetical protein